MGSLRLIRPIFEISYHYSATLLPSRHLFNLPFHLMICFALSLYSQPLFHYNPWLSSNNCPLLCSIFWDDNSNAFWKLDGFFFFPFVTKKQTSSRNCPLCFSVLEGFGFTYSQLPSQLAAGQFVVHVCYIFPFLMSSSTRHNHASCMSLNFGVIAHPAFKLLYQYLIKLPFAFLK